MHTLVVNVIILQVSVLLVLELEPLGQVVTVLQELIWIVVIIAPIWFVNKNVNLVYIQVLVLLVKVGETLPMIANAIQILWKILEQGNVNVLPDFS